MDCLSVWKNEKWKCHDENNTGQRLLNHRKLKAKYSAILDRAGDDSCLQAVNVTLHLYLLPIKPRLHQVHIAGYKYPGLATCIRIQVDTCSRDDKFVADTGYM